MTTNAPHTGNSPPKIEVELYHIEPYSGQNDEEGRLHAVCVGGGSNRCGDESNGSLTLWYMGRKGSK